MELDVFSCISGMLVLYKLNGNIFTEAVRYFHVELKGGIVTEVNYTCLCLCQDVTCIYLYMHISGPQIRTTNISVCGMMHCYLLTMQKGFVGARETSVLPLNLFLLVLDRTKENRVKCFSPPCYFRLIHFIPFTPTLGCASSQRQGSAAPHKRLNHGWRESVSLSVCPCVC